MTSQITSRDWLNAIDFKKNDEEDRKLTIFPLQFANCDRFRKHNAVYIFDEVGSGKTITSGLMVLDYLQMINKPNPKVLVVTINALKKSEDDSYGQFISDWYEKLPFNQLGYEYDKGYIKVVNNEYTSFLEKKSDYDIVVIDEAHLFLNKDTKRFENLTTNIKAQKIIFLTATPIKESSADLKQYVNIANHILYNKVDDNWIEELSPDKKKEDELICNTFNLNLPVTRYFKDTIQQLQYAKKAKPTIRKEPIIYKYNEDIDRATGFINFLQKYFVKGKTRFIVFTKYIEKEADLLFEKINKLNEDLQHLSTIEAVKITGENASDIKKYQQQVDLPDILILTYQIAEQGVNLPGFTHIVNYYMSAFPSSLEQRYGRIDRMNVKTVQGLPLNIYNCFLLSEKHSESSTTNFYKAVSTCIDELNSYLPSRNTLLSKEVLLEYFKNAKKIQVYINELLEFTVNDKVINHLLKLFENHTYQIRDEEEKIIQLYHNILEILDTNEVFSELSPDSSTDSNKQILRKNVEKRLKSLRGAFEEEKIHEQEKFVEQLTDQDWDKIFYSKNINFHGLSNGIETIDAINDCPQYILNNNKDSHDIYSSYTAYKEHFKKEIEPALTFLKYKDQINEYTEQIFISHNFFKYIEDKKYTEEVLKIIKESSENDYNIVKVHIIKFIFTLPFFKMVDEFTDCLNKQIRTKKNTLKYRFEGYENPLEATLRILYNNSNHLSKLLIEHYFTLDRNEEWYGKFFYIENVNNNIQATPWLKLLYYQLIKENNTKEFVFRNIFKNKSNQVRTWAEMAFQQITNGHKYNDTMIFDDKVTENILKSIK